MVAHFSTHVASTSEKHMTAMQTSEKPQSLEAVNPTKSDQNDEPPNGGYGWVCTVAAAVVMAHSWGFNSAYAVFLAYYLDHETFPGATRLEYAFIGSLSLTMTFLVSPIATVATKKYGVRYTMLVGMVFETVSLFCASAATQIWHLFLTQGILFGIGLGSLFVPVATIVPQWFTTKRSLASGISISGAGLGGFIYSLVAGAAIKNLGLVWTFRILGILSFTVNTTCILLIKDRNKPIKNTKISMELPLFKRGSFLLLIGFSCFTIFGYFILIFSLAHYGVEIGLTASQASLIAGLFNLGQAIGRPLIGYFSDAAGRVRMAGITTFLGGVICLAVWINAKSYGLLLFFTIAEGLVAGNFWATIAPLVAEVLGVEKVASGMNLVWLSIIIPATFSEPIALEITAATGKYLGAQLFAGFMYIAASACLGWLYIVQRKGRTTP